MSFERLGGRDPQRLPGGLSMSEQQDHLAAHERLSTGGLARWMRWCANHTWKVVLGWVGIIAILIVLVATVGGSLKDEFEIPGSDTQKRDRSDRGGVRLRAGLRAQPRLRGARGGTPRHARAQGCDRGRRREAQDVGVRPERGRGRRRQRRRPVLRADLLRGRSDRLHGGPVLGRHRDGGPIAGRRRAGRRARDGRARRASSSSSTATPSSRRSSRERRSCSASSPRSSSSCSSSGPSSPPPSRSRSRSSPSRRRSSCSSSSPG